MSKAKLQCRRESSEDMADAEKGKSLMHNKQGEVPPCARFYTKDGRNVNKRETTSVTSNPNRNGKSCNSKTAILIKDLLEEKFCKGKKHPFRFFISIS